MHREMALTRTYLPESEQIWMIFPLFIEGSPPLYGSRNCTSVSLSFYDFFFIFFTFEAYKFPLLFSPNFVKI